MTSNVKPEPSLVKLPDPCVQYLKWITVRLLEYSTKAPNISQPDEEWITQQVIYRYGKSYNHVINKQWDQIYPKIANPKIKRWICPLDITFEKIKEAYGGWGEYRYSEAATHVMIYNLLTSAGLNQPISSISIPPKINSFLIQPLEQKLQISLSSNSSDNTVTTTTIIYPLTNAKPDILLPLNMVDNMGPYPTPFWSYNRKYNTEQHILWPLSSHIFTFQSGINDTCKWSDKKHKLVFRGATTGPVKSFKTLDGNVKSSRFEIINQFAHCSWADFGFSTIVEHTKRTDPNWAHHEKQILALKKKSMTIKEMLNYRFILCIEGNDVSTSFGWVLASHSVPIHPYPFMFEVWFFQGLQPWVHFIPCKVDGSDLEQQMKWAQENDAECQKIAKKGREHMKRMLDPVLYVGILKRMCEIWDLRIKN